MLPEVFISNIEVEEMEDKNKRLIGSRICVGALVLIALVSNLSLAPYGIYVQFKYHDNVNCIKNEDPICVNVTLPCIIGGNEIIYNKPLADLNITNIKLPGLAIIPAIVGIILLIMGELWIFNDVYSKHDSGKIYPLIIILGLIGGLFLLCFTSNILMLSSMEDIYYYQEQGCYRLNNAEFFEMVKCYTMIDLTFLTCGIILIIISVLITMLVR